MHDVVRHPGQRHPKRRRWCRTDDDVDGSPAAQDLTTGGVSAARESRGGTTDAQRHTAYDKEAKDGAGTGRVFLDDGKLEKIQVIGAGKMLAMDCLPTTSRRARPARGGSRTSVAAADGVSCGRGRRRAERQGDD